MKKLYLLSLLAAFSGTVLGQNADVFEEKLTSPSNVATTINNLGSIGNSFRGSYTVEGFPSCEYPRGSGIEHLFDGGFWLGGILRGEELVSTGAYDAPAGYTPGRAGFEFTSKTSLQESSSLFDNPNFRPDAISHQDLFSVFSDTAITAKTNTGEIIITDHETPLNLEVEFRALNWNFAFANFFVILNYRVTNIGTDPIDSVYVGFWVDGVIRNTNITPAGSGGTNFYNKGGNGYIDSLNMGYEFDATGDIGFTDSYLGAKFLGAELNGQCPTSPNFDNHYNSWQFQNSADPLFFFPTSDRQRYAKMTSGLNFLPDWEGPIQEQLQLSGNRSTLVSAGPFTTMQPGDVVEVAFGIICAKRVFDGLPASANTAAQRENLIQNAEWAQTAYYGEDANANCILDPGEDIDGNGRITRFILPSPPDIPIVKVVPNENKVDVYWSDNSEFSIDPISQEMDFEGYRLYKTAIGFDLKSTQDVFEDLNLVAEFDLKGNGIGFETGLEAVRLDEPITFPDDTNTYYYQYTFENVANGWQQGIALTAFDQGEPVNNLESLESSPLANLKRAYAGKAANDGFTNGDPYAYPNPYYARADWEGPSSFEEDRKLYFANLPSRCEIRVYTVSGDLVDVIDHDASTYSGNDIRWFDTYSDTDATAFSGGEHAWDILSADDQVLARGLYVFVVIDRDTGEKRDGKFVLIK